MILTEIGNLWCRAPHCGGAADSISPAIGVNPQDENNLGPGYSCWCDRAAWPAFIAAPALRCWFNSNDDLDRLRTDPALKLACGRPPDSEVALCSQPTCSSTENLTDLRTVIRLGEGLVDLLLSSLGTPPTSAIPDLDDGLDAVHTFSRCRCPAPSGPTDPATDRSVCPASREPPGCRSAFISLNQKLATAPARAHMEGSLHGAGEGRRSNGSSGAMSGPSAISSWYSDIGRSTCSGQGNDESPVCNAPCSFGVRSRLSGPSPPLKGMH